MRFTARIAKIYSVAAGVLAAASTLAAPAEAGTSNGTLGLSLNVSAACVVNGGTTTSGSLGQLGTIVFPDQSGIFGDVGGMLTPTTGSGGLAVLCSPGLTPSVTIGAGAHDSGSVHHLASGANQVAYHLYSTADHSSEIGIGQQISLGTATQTAFNLPIYASVNSNGLVLPAGSYVDTVLVTLNW